MFNPFKVGDKVTVKGSAMGTGVSQDCTRGKAYDVLSVGYSSVSIRDDVGDYVNFDCHELNLVA